MLTAICYRCQFAVILHRKEGKKDYNSLQYLRQCCFLFWRSVLLSTPVLDLTAFLRVGSAFSWRPVLWGSPARALIYDITVSTSNTHTSRMFVWCFMDVHSPLGAVIRSTTWHRNLAFPSHPFLDGWQLTAVSGSAKAGTFFLSVIIRPVLGASQFPQAKCRTVSDITAVTGCVHPAACWRRAVYWWESD